MSSTANASWPSYASQTCRKSTNGAAAPSAAREAAVTRGPGYFGNTIRSAFDGRYPPFQICSGLTGFLSSNAADT